jgi:general stress protein YciG
MNDDVEQQVPVQPPDNRASSSGKPKARRGFAAMSPELLRELSRRGGVAAHTAGSAHRFTREEAKAAGRKGGLATHAKGDEEQSP